MAIPTKDAADAERLVQEMSDTPISDYEAACRSAGGYSTVPPPWKCKQCGQINSGHQTVCGKCGKKQNGGDQVFRTAEIFQSAVLAKTIKRAEDAEFALQRVLNCLDNGMIDGARIIAADAVQAARVKV